MFEKMPPVSLLSEKLRHENVAEVSRFTGLTRQSIYDIMNGKRKRPNLLTIWSLSKYFESKQSA